MDYRLSLTSVLLSDIHSLVRFSSTDSEGLADAYTKLGGVPRRCFRALLPEGNFVLVIQAHAHPIGSQSTRLLNDHVTRLVYEKIMHHETMRTRAPRLRVKTKKANLEAENYFRKGNGFSSLQSANKRRQRRSF